MVWPFNRKTNTEEVPAEVQDYYVEPKRERAGVAWALALGTLLVTIVVALGLFFGGRWAYRKLVSKDSNQPTTELPTEQIAQAPATPAPQSASDTLTENNTPPPATPGNLPGTTAPAPTPTGNANRTRPAPAGNIPDTGPGDTLGIFIATTVIAAVSHRIYTLRRL